MLLEDQTTVLFLADEGVSFAFSVRVFFSCKTADALFSDMPTTPVLAFTTVTEHTAVRPLDVLAVIFVVPTFIPLIIPFSDTVAIDELLLNHVTVLLVAEEGKTVAFSVLTD